MGNKMSGFLQATGVALYCSLIGLIFWQGQNIFPKVNTYFAPVAMLLLFSVSALICGLLVFYKPYKLFFCGEKERGRKHCSLYISLAFIFPRNILLTNDLLEVIVFSEI